MERKELYEAQSAVIGSLLIDPEIAGELFGTVGPEVFRVPELRTLYDAAKEIWNSGRRIDPVVVRNAVGPAYGAIIAQIMEETPTAAAWKEYADLAKSEARNDDVAQIGARLQRTATLTEQLELHRELGKRLEGGEDRDFSLKRAMFDWNDEMDRKPDPILTGIDALDDGRLHLRPGQFGIIAARPSAGKTALALQIMTEMARHRRVGFFTLETGRVELIDRILARTCHVPFEQIVSRAVNSETNWTAIARKQRELLKYCQLEIVEAAGYTVDRIRATAMNRRYDVIFIDYLSIIQPDKRFRDSYSAVTEISKQLHTFAQQTKTLVIALSQLSRAAADREPRLSDLRESGQIEQDADWVLLLHAENEEENDSPRVLRMAKNKTGMRGKWRFRFKGVYQEFEYMPPPRKNYS